MTFSPDPTTAELERYRRGASNTIEVRSQVGARVRTSLRYLSPFARPVWLAIFRVTPGKPIALLDDISSMGPFWQVEKRSDSPWCIALVRAWLAQCECSHDACRRNTRRSLPTRVVDVSSGGLEVDPRLVECSRDEVGSYLTLSYCWGSSQQVVTTQRNYRGHLSCIPLNRLS